MSIFANVWSKRYLMLKNPTNEKIEQNLNAFTQLDWFKTIYQESRYQSLFDQHPIIRNFIGKADVTAIITNTTSRQTFREQLLFLLGREWSRDKKRFPTLSQEEIA